MQWRGQKIAYDLLPKIKLEIVIPDDMVSKIVNSIQEMGMTEEGTWRRCCHFCLCNRPGDKYCHVCRGRKSDNAFKVKKRKRGVRVLC